MASARSTALKASDRPTGNIPAGAMPSLVSFLLQRLFFLLITLLISSLILYGVVATFPPEYRASLYLPPDPRGRLSEASKQILTRAVIQRYGLDDPFPVQYLRWLGSLVRGEWGWSTTAGQQVLPALLRLTPATAELTLFSVLLFFPLGIASGVAAGRRPGKPADHGLRLAAFVAGSIPPFVLALLLMAVFYVGVHWFPPGRLSDGLRLFVESDSFTRYTGFVTIDGLLNGRIDISLDGLRHLVLPAITLSAFHWATLARVTRVAMIEELGKEYVTAARARGVSLRRVAWRHALRNALLPVLNTSLLSAATLVTGVYIVERIFDFPGISEFLVNAMSGVPDVPAALGFSVYTDLAVLLFMTLLDLLQAWADPRYRQEATPA